jgi:hypothetical protein
MPLPSSRLMQLTSNGASAAAVAAAAATARSFHGGGGGLQPRESASARAGPGQGSSASAWASPRWKAAAASDEEGEPPALFLTSGRRGSAPGQAPQLFEFTPAPPPQSPFMGGAASAAMQPGAQDPQRRFSQPFVVPPLVLPIPQPGSSSGGLVVGGVQYYVPVTAGSVSSGYFGTPVAPPPPPPDFHDASYYAVPLSQPAPVQPMWQQQQQQLQQQAPVAMHFQTPTRSGRGGDGVGGPGVDAGPPFYGYGHEHDVLPFPMSAAAPAVGSGGPGTERARYQQPQQPTMMSPDAQPWSDAVVGVGTGGGALLVGGSARRDAPRYVATHSSSYVLESSRTMVVHTTTARQHYRQQRVVYPDSGRSDPDAGATLPHALPPPLAPQHSGRGGNSSHRINALVPRMSSNASSSLETSAAAGGGGTGGSARHGGGAPRVLGRHLTGGVGDSYPT